MDISQMKGALKALDQEVPKPFHLLIGGGAAFILAHQIPLLTMDIDGIPYQTDLSAVDIDPYVKKVAKKLELPADWLNTYFATFTFCLPKGYSDRLVSVFKGEKITALALGREDLLIMKCFAGREKDLPHAKLLMKQGLDFKLVADHLHHCLHLKLPKAQEALDFFYDCSEQLGINL